MERGVVGRDSMDLLRGLLLCLTEGGLGRTSRSRWSLELELARERECERPRGWGCAIVCGSAGEVGCMFCDDGCE